MTHEIWKPILGYEGIYEVSNMGRVRSLDRLCIGRGQRLESHKGRILCQTTLANGYKSVALRDKTHTRKSKRRTVHSLVAEAFLGPRPSKHDVMHLDGDRQNNIADNLRYGTRSENLRQTYEYGGKTSAGLLTREQVLTARQQLAAGRATREIAQDLGVRVQVIQSLASGRTFSWLREEGSDAT